MESRFFKFKLTELHLIRSAIGHSQLARLQLINDLVKGELRNTCFNQIRSHCDDNDELVRIMKDIDTEVARRKPQ